MTVPVLKYYTGKNSILEELQKVVKEGGQVSKGLVILGFGDYVSYITLLEKDALIRRERFVIPKKL